jgi:hypothetical protein
MQVFEMNIYLFNQYTMTEIIKNYSKPVDRKEQKTATNMQPMKYKQKYKQTQCCRGQMNT